MKVKKAEITAFLSLIVVLLISFIFGIIEITVIQTEKNLSRICADGAIFSVFGEYESQLMEAYHIFGLDGSYGTGEFNEDKIIGRMHYYSNKNIDIRSLLSGNKVPLVKTSDNWQLTLASLFTLGIGDDGISGADAEEGITYKEYLRAFLFLQPEEETTMRTIDRIEENMRLEQNCEKFRADHCVTKCEIRNKVEIFGDLAYTFPSYYGYE